VLGSCTGCQMRRESGLLPGALIRTSSLRFVNREQVLRVESTDTVWTRDYEKAQEILVVLKSGQGNYVADEATLDELESRGRVVARYVGENPNGSRRGIAGLTNEHGNVVGLVPH